MSQEKIANLQDGQCNNWVIQTLDVPTFFEKVAPHLADQIEDLANDMQHSMGFDFNLATYQQLFDLGMWDGVVVEDGEDIVGYASVLYTPHLHHKTVLLCQVDFIGSNKKKRGIGVGKILLADVEKRAREHGCTVVMYGLKDHKSTCLRDKLLGVGYMYAETKYTKEI